MKKIIFSILVSIIIFSSNCIVKAAFDINAKSSTYDSNIGLLTIYNDFTDDGDYSVDFNKIKLGSNQIKGTYRFEKNVLRIYINNKNIFNNQEEYIKDGIILKNLSLEKGAIVRTYRPPNSINIVLDSLSNEKILDTHIIALKPTMKIDNFTPSITTLSANGGNVIFYVNGVNLKDNDFEIRSSTSTLKYKMNVENTQASISINIPPNYLEKDRIEEYTLYCNNSITDKKISITILPKQIEKEDNITIQPDDNIDNNKKPGDNLDTDDGIIDNDVENESKDSENKSKDVDVEEKKENTNIKSENDVNIKKNNYIYYIVGTTMILIYILIKRKLNRKKIYK